MVCEKCKAAQLGNFIRFNAIVCPSCKEDFDAEESGEKDHRAIELPLELVDCEPSYIAVVGLRNAGKSHFIASLIPQIQEISSELHFRFICPDPATSNNYNMQYWKPLYDNRTLLPPTVPRDKMTDWTTKHPLIYTMEFLPPHHHRKIICFFYDSAGEDLETNDVLSLVSTLRYLEHAAGVIVLLDPLQLPGV